MSVTLSIRGVPEEVRDLLTEEARERGQSLQAYLLAILRRQADFRRNADLLAQIGAELAADGGATADAPHAADVLAVARSGRDRAGPAPGTPASRSAGRHPQT